jgi:hypothetical protein
MCCGSWGCIEELSFLLPRHELRLRRDPEDTDEKNEEKDECSSSGTVDDDVKTCDDIEDPIIAADFAMRDLLEDATGASAGSPLSVSSVDCILARRVG